MHDWGDKDPKIDWPGISDAAEFIATSLRKWGRVGVRDWKEKYGTVRVYCSLGWYSLHDITHPGHVWIRYARGSLMWYLNWAKWMRPVMRAINWVVVPYHVWLYKYTYGLALKKWPHLRAEILHGADFSELLEKYGIHHVRDSHNGYTIYYDWHPDNYVYPPTPLDETEVEDANAGDLQTIRSDEQGPT